MTTESTVNQVAKIVLTKLRQTPNFFGSIEFNFKAGQAPTANIKESVRVGGGVDVLVKERR